MFNGQLLFGKGFWARHLTSKQLSAVPHCPYYWWWRVSFKHFCTVFVPHISFPLLETGKGPFKGRWFCFSPSVPKQFIFHPSVIVEFVFFHIGFFTFLVVCYVGMYCSFSGFLHAANYYSSLRLHIFFIFIWSKKNTQCFSPTTQWTEPRVVCLQQMVCGWQELYSCVNKQDIAEKSMHVNFKTPFHNNQSDKDAAVSGTNRRMKRQAEQ